MKRDGGFVLLNALVLVAAMAAAAVFVVARTETGRAHLSAAQRSDQLDRYLDAFEAYAMTILMAEPQSVTALGGDWQIDARVLDVDRGQVSGSMTDLESKLNLNWLAAGNSPQQVAIIERAIAKTGASQDVSNVVVTALSPGIPENRRAYLALNPPRDPVGGARTLPVELRDIAGLREPDITKVEMVATLAPPDSGLNVNTAPAEIIAAFFPDLSKAQVDRVIAPRDDEPFASIEAFVQRVEEVQGAALDPELDISRLTVAGVWFRVDSVASLDGYTARRTTLIERQLNGFLPRVLWRVTQFP